MSMALLGIMEKIPGKERIMAKAIAPIHKAANAIAARTH